MRMTRSLTIVLVVGATMLVQGATRTIDFSDDTVGQSPKGFEFGHTAKVGAPGKWVIQVEGANKYLVQTDADATGARFPIAVVSDVTAADVDLSVRFKPVSIITAYTTATEVVESEMPAICACGQSQPSP